MSGIDELTMPVTKKKEKISPLHVVILVLVTNLLVITYYELFQAPDNVATEIETLTIPQGFITLEIVGSLSVPEALTLTKVSLYKTGAHLLLREAYLHPGQKSESLPLEQSKIKISIPEKSLSKIIGEKEVRVLPYLTQTTISSEKSYEFNL